MDAVTLITGAGSGIGRALALALALPPLGYAIAALDLHADPLRSLAAEIEKAGGRCAWAVGDVSIPDQVDGPMTVRLGVGVGAWILASLVLVEFAEMLGHFLANGASRALDRSNRHVVLRLTKGDANRVNELNRANQRSITGVTVRLAVAFAINVVAGIVTAWLLAGSTLLKP